MANERNPLARVSAEAPDDRCSCCGAGVFFEVRLSDLSKIAYASELKDAFPHHLCVNCTQLEAALIVQLGTRNIPERVAFYNRQQEKWS